MFNYGVFKWNYRFYLMTRSFEAKSLIVKEYSDWIIYLVKYDKTKCDMNDPDVRMCRGIVPEKIVIG